MSVVGAVQSVLYGMIPQQNPLAKDSPKVSPLPMKEKQLHQHRQTHTLTCK